VLKEVRCHKERTKTPIQTRKSLGDEEKKKSAQGFTPEKVNKIATNRQGGIHSTEKTEKNESITGKHRVGEENGMGWLGT